MIYFHVFSFFAATKPDYFTYDRKIGKHSKCQKKYIVENKNGIILTTNTDDVWKQGQRVGSRSSRSDCDAQIAMKKNVTETWNIITTAKALNLHPHNNAFKHSGTRYACLHNQETLKFTVFTRTIPIVWVSLDERNAPFVI